jgi:serine/threonine-protein kinase
MSTNAAAIAAQKLVGQMVAGYTIGPLIATGGMGAIYNAAGPMATTEPLAIKILRPEFADQPEFLKRFEREAYLLMMIDHPHIVPVYDFGHSEDVTFLVMRLIRGPTLHTFEAEHRFSPQTARQVIEPLASALDYAHARQIIHRDLKPGNVLLEPRPPDSHHVYLTDFGLSKTSGTSILTVAGKSLGTPQYMSPEQVLDYPIDKRSDVYALGVLTYQLLLGRLPFNAKTPQQVAWMHVKDMPPPPRQLVPAFPRPLEDILLRALAKSPSDRYEAASDFSRAYAQAVEKLSSSARTASYWIGPPAIMPLKSEKS